MSLYDKDAKRKTDREIGLKWLKDNVSHYKNEAGIISVDDFLKLSPYERDRGKYKSVFKKDLVRTEENNEQPPNKELYQKIAQILRDNITFSPQVEGYVIHGAIEKIIDLFKNEKP